MTEQYEVVTLQGSLNSVRVRVHLKRDLICTADGHSKFWSGMMGEDLSTEKATTTPWLITLHWGRIGTTGNQPEIKRFNNKWEASKYLQSRITDKLRKGYIDSSPEAKTAAKAVKSASSQLEGFEWDL